MLVALVLSIFQSIETPDSSEDDLSMDFDCPECIKLLGACKLSFPIGRGEIERGFQLGVCEPVKSIRGVIDGPPGGLLLSKSIAFEVEGEGNFQESAASSFLNDSKARDNGTASFSGFSGAKSDTELSVYCRFLGVAGLRQDEEPGLAYPPPPSVKGVRDCMLLPPRSLRRFFTPRP